jgi:hypothetical protein
MRIGWLENENHFVTTLPFHLEPPNAHVAILLRNAMAAGREKDLYKPTQD